MALLNAYGHDETRTMLVSLELQCLNDENILLGVPYYKGMGCSFVLRGSFPQGDNWSVVITPMSKVKLTLFPLHKKSLKLV